MRPAKEISMTTTDSSKLSPHMTWLFAFGSIAAGIATSYALSGLGQKVTAAVYFAIVAIGGFLSTYLTRARVRGAVLTFLVGAVTAAGAYFLLIDHIVATATSTINDTLGGNHAEGARAGAAMGKTMGMFVAAIVFLETIVAGIGGAFAGAKSRGKSGLAALGSLMKTAQ
jgi:hypothetical protein